MHGAGPFVDLLMPATIGSNAAETPPEAVERPDWNVSKPVLNGRLFESPTLNEVLTGTHVTAPFYWDGRPESEIR